ncbi:hypothetical protein HPP92_026597 [Vanilla planifolia]|uniref:HMA domain-containing protein n=1 Tax=Vanilla planifolia TaxID=51239 RepID=A0A835PDM9_VANPL|nr:hypothetical protein HPP92_026816 [Vanilla planifolia]KAG0450722.1 hypothetical protein HPP92_026597 [Vanilla planifolia]
MATGVVETEAGSFQTWVLKVSIHCEGCKKKVRKVLRGVHGVQMVDVDSKQNKVTVTGNVDAEALIQRLLKYGKHAEVWPETKLTESNSSGVVSRDTVVKVEEKVIQAEQHAASAKNKQEAEEGKDTSPAETNSTVKPDASPSGDVAEVKSNKNEPEETEKDSEKPIDAGEASSEATEKVSTEKEKEVVERKAGSGDEGNAQESDGDTAPSAAGFATPPPMIPPSTANTQPVYTMSYNMGQPSASYSYYAAAPPPAMLSSYAYPGYALQEHYPSDPYYGSMEPSTSSVGSLDMFNDENPNACNLM